MIVATLIEYCLKPEARKDTTAPEARESRLYKMGSRRKYSLIAHQRSYFRRLLRDRTLAADHRQGSLSLGFKMLAGPWILNRQYGSVIQ